MTDYTGIEFLDKLYQNLYMSDEVQHTKENTDNRKEAIQKYMDRLERIHKEADTESKKALLKSLYYNKYVIKEDVLRDKIIKMNLNPSDERIKIAIKSIIDSQKKSLDKWLNYLTSETAHYPMWAKYWVFQGMLKMGNYDEGIEGYQKRSKDTEAPFVDCNPEIISKAISIVQKILKKDEINDDELTRVISSGSFQKIYTVLEKRYIKNSIEYSGTEGIWKKYNQGNKDEAIKLSQSIQDKNTHWCTADEDTAIKQVCGPYDTSYGGDFYVYYTKDKEDNYTLPRIAIRMNGHNEIGEIRGILDGQNIEEEMVPILESKLNEMFLRQDDKRKALIKTNELKELTKLYKKSVQNEELTEEELRDLYLKDYGFGWTQDPRVEKIQKNRNIEEDLNIIKDDSLKVKIIAENRIPSGTIINDKELLLKAAKEHVSAIEYASDKLKSNKEFILEVLETDVAAMNFASEELKNDKEFILKAVKKLGLLLKSASDELKNDKDVVLTAVRSSGSAICYASENLKNNKEVVLEAVKQDGKMLEYVSEELRNDKEVVLEAVKHQHVIDVLQYASEELRNDKEIVLASVKENPYSLDSASNELKNNKEVVLEVVKQDGEMLEYLSEELKNDKEVVLEAVKHQHAIDVLQYASEELRNDKEIVLAAVKENGLSLESASNELRNDKEVVLEAVKKSGRSLSYASEELRNDKEVVLEAVKENGLSLESASNELRNDKEVVFEAVKQAADSINFASEELKNDKEFISMIIEFYDNKNRNKGIKK